MNVVLDYTLATVVLHQHFRGWSSASANLELNVSPEPRVVKNSV